MSEYVQDWERCINCKVAGRNGVIKHLRGCPDYVRERPREKK